MNTTEFVNQLESTLRAFPRETRHKAVLQITDARRWKELRALWLIDPFAMKCDWLGTTVYGPEVTLSPPAFKAVWADEEAGYSAWSSA